MTANQTKVDAAQLGRALIEQARLGDAYVHAVGTASEQSAFERLRRAGAHVSVCDRRVKQPRRSYSAKSATDTPQLG